MSASSKVSIREPDTTQKYPHALKKSATPRYLPRFCEQKSSSADRIIQAKQLSSDAITKLNLPISNFKKITEVQEEKNFNSFFEAEACFAFRNGSDILLSPYSIVLFLLAEAKENFPSNPKTLTKSETLKQIVNTIISNGKIQEAFLIRIKKLYEFTDNYIKNEGKYTDSVLHLKKQLQTILSKKTPSFKSLFKSLNNSGITSQLASILCNSEKGYLQIQDLLMRLEQKPRSLKPLIKMAANDLKFMPRSSSSYSTEAFKYKFKKTLELTKDKILRSIMPHDRILYNTFKINGTSVDLTIKSEESKEDVFHRLLDPLIKDQKERAKAVNYLLKESSEPHWISTLLKFGTIESFNIADRILRHRYPDFFTVPYHIKHNEGVEIQISGKDANKFVLLQTRKCSIYHRINAGDPDKKQTITLPVATLVLKWQIKKIENKVEGLLDIEKLSFTKTATENDKTWIKKQMKRPSPLPADWETTYPKPKYRPLPLID